MRLKLRDMLKDFCKEVRRTASEHLLYAQEGLIGDAVCFGSHVNELGYDGHNEKMLWPLKVPKFISLPEP